MSFLSWFTRKPAPVQAGQSDALSALRPDVTAPIGQNRNARPGSEPPVGDQANTRKNERMERRELLYTVVRDAMVRAGVLSASYKFKVLSLDQRGSQFLVMMDVAREFGGDTGRLSEIEALIAQTAKSRYEIAVTAVYWRINDHVAVGIPLRSSPVAPAPRAASPVPGAPVNQASAVVQATSPNPTATGSSTQPLTAPAPIVNKPLVRPSPSMFDPIEADEVAAFRKALGNASAGRTSSTSSAPSVSVRDNARRKLGSDDFADTEMTGGAARSPDLGVTQYGDL